MANEFTDLIKKINEVVSSPQLLNTAMSTVLAVHKPRIFEQGFDAKGVKIGVYSTNPTSISKKNQARNTGQTYFPGGYSEYKQAVGKNPGYVIFRNTDQMYADYGIIGNGFGFQNTENYNKSQWMENKYQRGIFELSGNELDVLTNTLVDQLKRALG